MVRPPLVPHSAIRESRNSSSAKGCDYPASTSANGRNMIRVGVIGYGYWGPNVVRNLHGLDRAFVEMACDKSHAALARVRKAYPGISTTSDPKDTLPSPPPHAPPAPTPSRTHTEQTKT